MAPRKKRPAVLEEVAPGVLKDARFPTYKTLMDRIQARFDLERGAQARAAEALGMDSGSLRHHMNRRGWKSPAVKGMMLDVEQIAAIAEELDAPRGWPWLPWGDAELFEAFAKLSPDARAILQQLVPSRGP
jgi:hypothetical protein